MKKLSKDVMTNNVQLKQHTLRCPINFAGVGLHTGEIGDITLTPAVPFTGIKFVFNDAEQTHVAATLSNVKSTSYATLLAYKNQSVSTVEHLLAALYAHNVNNCLIYVSGNEIPILDGSANLFSQKIVGAGIIAQDEDVSVFMFPEARIEYNDSYIITVPNPERFILSAHAEFKNISQQKTMAINEYSFHNEIAPAKTFVYSDDVVKLKAAGLIKGGSLDNACVLDAGGNVINPENSVFQDDIIRHKMLDVIGDFSLCGKRLFGEVFIYKPGHSVNTYFINKLVNGDIK